uniref:Uncharacterized protein n=1 Tax=Zea mays TaxID=4577 RepID=C0PI75_MAIZE|nr:unknown [Zea mays]
MLLLCAVGVLNSWAFFYSVMNFWHTYLGLRWELVITSQKKFGTGLNFSWNFPRLFKYAGVLVPLGAVAGCNFFVCACPALLGIGIFLLYSSLLYQPLTN